VVWVKLRPSSEPSNKIFGVEASWIPYANRRRKSCAGRTTELPGVSTHVRRSRRRSKRDARSNGMWTKGWGWGSPCDDAMTEKQTNATKGRGSVNVANNLIETNNRIDDNQTEKSEKRRWKWREPKRRSYPYDLERCIVSLRCRNHQAKSRKRKQSKSS
jgi:hypothetical protein